MALLTSFRPLPAGSSARPGRRAGPAHAAWGTTIAQPGPASSRVAGPADDQVPRSPGDEQGGGRWTGGVVARRAVSSPVPVDVCGNQFERSGESRSRGTSVTKVLYCPRWFSPARQVGIGRRPGRRCRGIRRPAGRSARAAGPSPEAPREQPGEGLARGSAGQLGVGHARLLEVDHVEAVPPAPSAWRQSARGLPRGRYGDASARSRRATPVPGAAAPRARPPARPSRARPPPRAASPRASSSAMTSPVRCSIVYWSTRLGVRRCGSSRADQAPTA